MRVLEKNTELTIQNTDLQKQVHHLQNVSIMFHMNKLKLQYADLIILLQSPTHGPSGRLDIMTVASLLFSGSF